jgi:HAD superfamily hydrolase (TIGR01490 family)
MRSSWRSPAASQLEEAGERRAAAFFDLDKTLMAGSSGMVWARVSVGAGLFPRRLLARWAVDHLRYRLRGASDDAAAQVMAEVRDVVTGMAVSDLEDLGPAVLEGVLPRVYPEMLDEVRSHRKAGRPTFIVSAAGSYVVEELARELEMDGGVGTGYEIRDGAFTGELDGPFMYGKGKVAAIERLAEELGIDLGVSYAYSDSASDLPMLRAVGNPVVVNPDAALLAVARSEGWRVMRFEKLGRRLAAGAALAAGLLAMAVAFAVGARRRH